MEFNELIIKNDNKRLSDRKLGEMRNERIRLYNIMNPYYAEVCTHTQYRPKDIIDDAKEGGPGGHATIFLNGACLDSSKNYPQLKLCDENVDLTDPELSGVGVSLNYMFASVRFVAIPGRKNFYRGIVPWGEKINNDVVKKTREYFYSKPWHDGIYMASEHIDKCHCKEKKCTGLEMKKCLIDQNTGIDFAISYARDSYCSKLPMPKYALKKVIDNLNQSNTDAQNNSINFTPNNEGFLEKNLSSRGYKYDVFLDNCSHLIHNAIAATGFYDFKKRLESNALNSFVRAWVSELAADIGLNSLTGGEFGYMSIPVHNVNRLALRSIELDVDKISEIYDNVSKVVEHDEYSWLPSGAGNIVEVFKMRSNNVAFLEGEIGVSFFLAEEEFEQFFDEYDSDHRPYFSNYCENLLYHRDHYLKAWNVTAAKLASYDDYAIRWPYLSERNISLKFLRKYQKLVMQGLDKIDQNISFIKESTKPYCKGTF